MYKERAVFICKERGNAYKENGIVKTLQERYRYKGNDYWVELDSETPEELQHKFEQDFIDYYIEHENDDMIHDMLEELYPEDFC